MTEETIIKMLKDIPEMVLIQEKHLEAIFGTDKKTLHRCIAIVRPEIGTNEKIIKDFWDKKENTYPEIKELKETIKILRRIINISKEIRETEKD